MWCGKSLVGLAKTAVYDIFDGASGQPICGLTPSLPLKDTKMPQTVAIVANDDANATL
jgi:hypothetical protein